MKSKPQEINETAREESCQGSNSHSVHECYLNVKRGIPELVDDDGDVADEFYICRGDGARGWLEQVEICALGVACSSAEESPAPRGQM